MQFPTLSQSAVQQEVTTKERKAKRGLVFGTVLFSVCELREVQARTRASGRDSGSR
jgi:hypothetical protein